MTEVTSLPIRSWDQPASPAEQALAIERLEQGCVLLFPHLPFSPLEEERSLLATQLIGGTKNVSLLPSTGAIKGIEGTEDQVRAVQQMMMRFAHSTRSLIDHLLPQYSAGIQQARTSFRPAEIAGRQSSWRKDDTRLHVDSFPSSPTQGNRILRVFSNINPQGLPRHWRLGESFDAVAKRHLPALRKPLWGSSHALHALGITKARRSAYDHYMLHLHDRMKFDTGYQAQVDQSEHLFPAGCTWMVFTDQVSHAALSGQFALEQTYMLPVAQMRSPQLAPISVLESLLGRKLA